MAFKHILAVLAFAPLFAHASQADQLSPRPFDECKVEAIYGFPVGQKQDVTKICRHGYVEVYDNKAKIPVWAAYVLTPIRATGCYSRSNAFTPDWSVPASARATTKDYAKSGYDMGHQVNDGDMRWDGQAETESFILSNMAPQLPHFNRGIWKKLEDSTRGWTISRRHALQVYVGPIYDNAQDTHIGVDQVDVPHGFFKVIIDTETQETMVFVFKHEESKADLSTFITSLAELQRQTGLVLPMPPKPVFSAETWPRVMKSASRTKATVCSLKP